MFGGGVGRGSRPPGGWVVGGVPPPPPGPFGWRGGPPPDVGGTVAVPGTEGASVGGAAGAASCVVGRVDGARPRASSMLLNSGARETRWSRATRPQRAPSALNAKALSHRCTKPPRRPSTAMAAPTSVSPGAMAGSTSDWSKLRSLSRAGRSTR